MNTSWPRKHSLSVDKDNTANYFSLELPTCLFPKCADTGGAGSSSLCVLQQRQRCQGRVLRGNSSTATGIPVERHWSVIFGLLGVGMKCHSLEVSCSVLNPSKLEVHELPALPSPSVQAGGAGVLPDAWLGHPGTPGPLPKYRVPWPPTLVSQRKSCMSRHE